MMDPERALAGLWAASDSNNTHLRREAKENDPEAYAHYNPETYYLEQIRNRSCQDVHFMLLSLILDVARKISYIRLATNASVTSADDIDASLAARIAAHAEVLREDDAALPDIDWEVRAEKAWRILLKDLLLEQETRGGTTRTAEQTTMDMLRARAGQAAIDAEVTRVRDLIAP